MKNSFDKVDDIETKDRLYEFVNNLRRIAVNQKSENILKIAKKAFTKSMEIKDNKSAVRLYDIKIRLLYHKLTNLPIIEEMLSKMQKLSQNINFIEGIALVNQLMYHIEKLKGNNEASKQALEKAIKIVRTKDFQDEYTLFGCEYSYALDKWLEFHDFTVSYILEECLVYFYNNGFFRSLAHTIGVLGVIYTKMNNSRKILEISKLIFVNKSLFNELPPDIKGLSYYFAGLGYMLDLNLHFAEAFFKDAYNTLKPIHKESIYFSNFIILHSFLCTVTALQGKFEQSLILIEEAENLLKQDFFEKNLDLVTKKQIYHTLNLNKFYVYSRLKNFDTEKMQDLIEDVYIGSKSFYSNFMLLCEFILNSNLEYIKMKELLDTNNFSLNRVKHIILFILQKDEEKEESSDWKHLQRMEILKNREKTTKTTFIENVFADLLIAQQLFSLKRFEEIYTLLRKYEKQLQRIEVLELRIFMEAFIQVGAFKNGDPLGPALQYMAIKKCRNYGFSRLENKLLAYLDMQHIDNQSTIL